VSARETQADDSRVGDTSGRVMGNMGEAIAHESAGQHVRGAAWYTDDIPEPKGTLYAAIGGSREAHADIVSINLDAVWAAPGVVDVITAADIPGVNDCGPVVADDPILADDLVEFVGQPLFAVLATSVRAARRAVSKAAVTYRSKEAVIDVEDALAKEMFIAPTETMARGDVDAALASSSHVIEGKLRIGGQEQFYLEGQVALAKPGDDGLMHVHSSTQFPMEIQAAVARCLGREHMHDVLVECRRMGGAFGGKESQAAFIACIAAVFVERNGCAVKLRLDRDEDMIMTGKRHDFVAHYVAGFNDEGVVSGYRVTLASRCGRSTDLSVAINDRAMLHSDNAYYLPAVEVVSHRCKTHTVSNTAFRGFGGPQGMVVTENVMDAIARKLKLDALDVRAANLYSSPGRDVTPYGQSAADLPLAVMLDELISSADYRQRRTEIEAFNASHRVLKRGMAVTPVKFGISFTATHLNQAGALVHIYHDGSVHLNHGGTEMGQGLFTKVAQVVASELGVEVGRIRSSATDTSKVPNASATAASSGTDLNGKAAQAAARTLRERLADFVAEQHDVARDGVVFEDAMVRFGEQSVTFNELVHAAYMHRVPLSATGFYATPEIGYDRRTWNGQPFFYYACGIAVSEATIDTLTGEARVNRVDILHDCGRSLNPAIDIGQVEGGYLQGLGWLTSESLWFNEHGALGTHAPSTYKIPACSDWPEVSNVALYESAPNDKDTVFRSKAVGEPPLMLAISGFLAIKDAVSAVGGHDTEPSLDAPATPEAILDACEQLRASVAAR
jgi:xanthine dehydrogenase large subunit